MVFYFFFVLFLFEEIEDGTYVFIQDYHFSILPRIIKERHPTAKIAIFWHIPWPNPRPSAYVHGGARYFMGCWAQTL